MRSFARSGAYALAVALSGLTCVKAQVSAPNNNPPFGSYVGHMGANTNPVQVRHNGNYPIFASAGSPEERRDPAELSSIKIFEP
jgi:hypothetical protein